MLERASTCLESGGRQLLRAPKQCLRSRRTPHSSLWHHGASDLGLPAGWASAPALDFLYPEKTLALIRRWPTTAETQRKPWQGTGIRRYSTAPWVEDQVDDPDAARWTYEMKALLREHPPRDALGKLLNRRDPGKQPLAWRLYLATPRHERTHPLQIALLDYLATDSSVDASRMLQIFDAISPKHRTVSAFRIAICAYVALKMVGPAIQLHEEATSKFDHFDIGISTILGRTVLDDQWDLSLRVFNAFLRQAARTNVDVSTWTRTRAHPEFPVLWGAVAQLPDLRGHLDSLLHHVREYKHELTATDESKAALGLFVEMFTLGVMQQIIPTPNADRESSLAYFTRLFDELEFLELPTAGIYEFTITQLTRDDNYRSYTNARKPFHVLYARYKDMCIVNTRPEQRRRPSQHVIKHLMKQLGRFDGIDRVLGYLDDLRHFYPGERLSPGILNFLISFFAEHGMVDHVHDFFDQLHGSYRDKVDLKVLSMLPFAYARRIDVAGAVAQFKRISQDFGALPDAACWNCLLLAYTRAEDFDGALECFNNMLESGLEPDKHTFGPLLDLCARRADIEAYEALFSKASQLKVKLDADMHARAGYVQAFLNADDDEGAKAIVNAMLQAHRAGTLQGSLTHAFNMIITHYAIAGKMDDARAQYNQMRDNAVPLDTWTYAALMRGLIEISQTNAAYRILRVTMPSHGVQVHAFHYALIMMGFLNERQYDLAMWAYRRMVSRGIPQTPSSRRAGLLVTGVNELLQLKKEKLSDPQERLRAVEKRLRDGIIADLGRELANRQPHHNRYIESSELSSVPQSYIGLVILLYSTRGAYEICKELFDMASKFRTEAAVYKTPISLLVAIMEAHLKAGEHDEVAKCWEFAREQAIQHVKTLQQVVNPPPPTPQFDSLIDPAVKARTELAHIALNRRQILWRAMRIYIRSLLAQPNASALQQAQRTINDLLVNGFAVDSLTWNEFIQGLASRGRLLDAFSACESYLIPHFPGWRRLQPYYVVKDRPGYSWMELTHKDVRRDSVLPRYKTLVILSAAYAQVKRDEANGLGYNPDLGGWAREVLEQIAPKTIEAVETMPRTGDQLQKSYFGDA